MKKLLKRMAVVIISVLTFFSFAGCNALDAIYKAAFATIDIIYSNPISLSAAMDKVKDYIKKTYPDKDYQIDKFYRKSTNDYVAEVSSPTGVDEYFEIGLSANGHIEWNTHGNVSGGYNTEKRLQSEYGKFVTQKKKNHEPFPYDIYATLRFNYYYGYTKHKDAFLPKDLEVNGVYDVEALGKVQGLLIIRAEVEKPTVKKAAEILLQLKEYADEIGIPFYRVKIELYSIGRMGDNFLAGKPKVDVREFFYPDIYEEGMVERVRAAHEATCAYYETHSKSLEMDY